MEGCWGESAYLAMPRSTSARAAAWSPVTSATSARRSDSQARQYDGRAGRGARGRRPPAPGAPPASPASTTGRPAVASPRSALPPRRPTGARRGSTRRDREGTATPARRHGSPGGGGERASTRQGFPCGCRLAHVAQGVAEIHIQLPYREAVARLLGGVAASAESGHPPLPRPGPQLDHPAAQLVRRARLRDVGGVTHLGQGGGQLVGLAAASEEP